MILFWLLGSCGILYANVYIFDTRNGVGLAVIIFGLMSLVLLVCWTASLLGNPNLKKELLHPTFLAILLTIVGWFTWQQYQLNSG